MNFTLNGQTVTVRIVDVDTRGQRIGIAVSVNGQHVGYRGTMANALTLATHATAIIHASRHTMHTPPHVTPDDYRYDGCPVCIAAGLDPAYCPDNVDANGIRFDGGND